MCVCVCERAESGAALNALIITALGLRPFPWINVFLAWLIHVLKYQSGYSVILPKLEQLPLECHHLTMPCSRFSTSQGGEAALILVSVSFQEEDLNCIRERWSDALIKRREYLDEQIKKIINKQGEGLLGCC